ncbi:MAG: SBBP repeat-containing protein [Polyangiaceae bacterium]
MASFYDLQPSARYQLSHLLIGGLLLFGCSSKNEEHGACDPNAQCSPQGDGGSASGGRGNTQLAAGTSGTGDPGGAVVAGSGGQAGNPVGGAPNSGGVGNTLGGTGDGAASGVGGSAVGGSAGSAGPKICPDGAFDHDGDPTNLCKAWTRCAAGQYIAQDGSDTSDQVCALCGTGTFSAKQNAHVCLAWTECGTNTYSSRAGSATADQQCSACPSAQATQSACLPQGACLFAGSCQPGTVQVAPATATKPAKCAACGAGDYCVGGLAPQVRCESGTWDHDADPATCCSAWTTCAAGTYVAQEGSASANRQCSSCPSGSFSESLNAASCTPWKTCPPAATTWPQNGVATAGSTTSDAVCGDPYYRFSDAFGASAVALDGAGNVYIAGNTNSALAGPNAGGSDAVVRKLDAHGATLWTRQFGTPSDDYASGVALDASGNVYVTGTTYGSLEGASAGTADGFLRKLDGSGATLWTKQFGTLGPDSPRALVVAGSNAYVAGSTYPTGNQNSGDPFGRKFDASGATSWMQEFGGADEDEAFAVAVDGSGNVYVAGYTFDLIPASTQGQRDAFVRKLDPSGSTLWTRQFGTSDDDYVYAAAVDGNGNLYLAGLTYGVLLSGGGMPPDAFVRKFDTSGATLWTRQFGSLDADYGIALGLDGTNNLYVAGTTYGALGGPNAGQEDVFVRKLDAAGTTLWTKQVGTSKDESTQGAAVSATGTVYVVGYSNDGVSAAGFVLQIPDQTP